MMTDSRKSEISNLLKDLYISAEKSNYLYNESSIYHYLIKRNVPKKDRDVYFYGFEGGKKNNKLFNRWIDKFKKNPNIRVFCSPYWEYFCQFINGRVDSSRCIKMYIPVDNKHIEESANRIFSFLAKNNISHLSKIGSEIRFDDIVIRLNTKADALKLQKFIDNDKYIQEGLFKGNPFAFSNNGINYAYDGHTSFNMCLSHLISIYVNSRVRSKSLTIDDVNADDF